MSPALRVKERVQVQQRTGPLAVLRKNSTAYVLIAPAVLIQIGLIAYPVLVTIATSFSRLDKTGRIQVFGTLANYIKLLHNTETWNVIWQTLRWSASSVFLTTVLGLILAVTLNQQFPGRRLVRGLVILPWAVPVSVSAIIWRWLYHGQLGALNYVLKSLGLIQHYHEWLGQPLSAFFSALAVEVWSSVPFMTITLLAGLQSMPGDVFEAARIDGCDAVRAFRYMTLPLLRPVLTLATLLTLIWSFNSFPNIWILTKGGPANRTDIAVTYIYKQAFQAFDLGSASAMAVLALLILLAVSWIYGRLFKTEEA